MRELARFAILACDCNSMAALSTYPLLSQRMTSDQRTAPDGVAYRANLASVDHVFLRGAVHALGAYEVRNVGGSDHAPFLVEFTFDEIE